MSPIRLGTPSTRRPDEPPPPESRTGELRGYAVESGVRAKPKPKKEKTGEAQGVNPVILFAAAIALVILLLVIVVGPAKPSRDSLAEENKALVVSYEAYLNKKKPPGVDVGARVQEVRERLEAIAWAERVGREDLVRRELDLLLLLDADRASPVYRYASKHLANR